MNTSERETLFEGKPGDVRLPAAPLLRVIGQLRFGPLAVLAAGDDAAQMFIKLLAEDYPFVEQGQEQTLLFASGQPVQQQNVGKVWRLRTADQQSVAALTTAGALTYETTSYPGRTAFCRELTRLTDALRQATHLQSFNRVGVRYSNQLTGPETLAQLPQLIHPELLGVVGAPVAAGATLSHQVTQAQFELGPRAKVLAHFGCLPANGAFDESLPPAPEPSWILDIDSFEEFPDVTSALPAESEAVSTAAHACAEMAYAFFRWATKPQFLRHFGGKP